MFCSLACAGISLAAEVEIVPQNPRPFGYVVGDTVKRSLTIDVKSGQTLDEKSLPKPGRINAWLDLRAIGIDKSSLATGPRYRIDLTYQLPNSPTEVKVVELPAHKFNFIGSGKTIDVAANEWPITLAPITPEEVLARDGLEAMRPDIAPMGLDTGAMRLRLTALVLILAAIMFYWAYRYFGIPFIAKTQRPFTRAYRDLQRGKQSMRPVGNAIERIHKALNETAGRSLFLENIDEFLKSRNATVNLSAQTREFFRLSRAEFFAGSAADSNASFKWLMDFCRAWRDEERGVV